MVKKMITKISWRNAMKDLNSRLEIEEMALNTCQEVLDYYEAHPQNQDEEHIALYNYLKIKSQNTVKRLKELKEKMEVEVA